MDVNRLSSEKHPKEDTPEDFTNLTAFYHSHGFNQDDQSRKISFDMKNYQPSSFEVSERQ